MPRRRPALLAASLLLAPPLCAAQEIIHAMYSERPPYMAAQPDGSPAGLTGTPAANAFRHAGVAVEWLRLPTNRQLLRLKDPHALNCAIGWFNVPERTAYSKLTRPIYRDHGWVALSNARFAARAYTSLDELMRHPEVRLLVKDNYSYGGLDPLIQRWRPTIAVSTGSTLKMVQSVGAGLVDLMFITEDESQYILRHQAGEYGANLRVLRFKDMPHGSERHILCSKAVPDEVIDRLNKAITFR
ncbi:hypothetical protein [Duganella callida]|uniref:Transporter substrate-binding domain-containing protein n=1 Tax=Duganella callida TaxID=2561932 RepID=A0A4Y9S812_9BURK|nr:hypothetical protein [Duganella callida]TFW17464.1 hypothetical protein E4L98_20570 [Duganella callida]